MFKSINPAEEMSLDYGEAWRFIKLYQLNDIPVSAVSLCEKINSIMSFFGGRDCDFWLGETLNNKEWSEIRRMAGEAVLIFKDNNVL